MKELFIIAVGSALVNNVVLSQFLGICRSLEYLRRLRQRPVWVERLFLSSQSLLFARV